MGHGILIKNIMFDMGLTICHQRRWPGAERRTRRGAWLTNKRLWQESAGVMTQTGGGCYA